MNATRKQIFVVGRFPPPFDGQALATELHARRFENAFNVVRVETHPRERMVRRRSPLTVERFLYFFGLRRRIRDALAVDRRAAVFWTSISPSPSGHFRDFIAVLPGFEPTHRVIAVVHRGDFDRLFRSKTTSWTARWMVRRLSGVVFLTEHLSERCSVWIPAEKRFVIPNAVDDELTFTDEEVRACRQSRPNRTRLRLLFVAHMIVSKGYLDVLEATAELVRRGIASETHFAGQWLSEDDRRSFQRRVAELGIDQHVFHHRLIADRMELKELYRESDILVLPTYYENEAQPQSIIEALNAGLPIITTRHAGIPEVVNEGEEAIFVKMRDPASIATAIARLSSHDLWLRMSIAARHRFCCRYAGEVVREKWNDLLQTILERPISSD